MSWLPVENSFVVMIVLLPFSFCYTYVLSNRAVPNLLVVTIRDAYMFVHAEDVSSILATFSTANVTFLPAQRYGK